ncbi:MAG: DNRLRE domain-containing protein [Candidatus Limiplasma sp.]|nr:DNRLRE domain-containing protein [Candidatus Limiplasma sp.]
MKEKTTMDRPVSRHFDTRRMRGEEVQAQRNECSKTFALGRGLYQTVVYPERVHYRDKKGDWREIDNRLKPTAKGGPALENTSGPLLTRLALRGDANPLVTIQDERKHMLRWRLEGAGGVSCTQGKPLPRSDDEDENRAHADKSTSTVQYAGILPHTDLICELRSDGLKEALVLNDPDAPAQYRFTLDINGLAWEETAGGLRLWDRANPGEDTFRLPAPYMIDAAGRLGEVRTEWQTMGGSLLMTMTPDAEFLGSAQYPVVIDPTVQSSQTATNILDTFLSESNKTTNYGSAQTLRVGKHSTYGQCRALVKITNLPALTSAYTVAKAWMGLAVLPTSSNTGDAYLYAHEVLENWGQTTVNWNNQPRHDEKHLDYTLIKKGEAEAKSAQVDITNLVRKWYANKAENFGVMLDSHGEQAIELCSSENTAYASTARPVIHVNYVSAAGLESYLAYESFGAGRAGTAHVALHSGHLVVDRGLTAMNGNRMPISLGLTWNACHMDANSFGVGKGWRLNWNQNLRREQPASGDYYYVLTDGDGTEHEFHKHVRTQEEQGQSGFVDYYEDRSRLSLKLYEGTSESEIVSKDHSKLVFDKPTADYTGTLTSATVKMVKRALDAHGNTATLIHDSSFRLTQATDGVGRVTTLAYTASDVQITVPGYGQKVVLSLDGGQRLTAVTDLDGGRSEYEYGAEPADPNDPNPPAPNPAAANRLRLLRNTVDGTHVNPTYDGRDRVIQMRVWGMEDPRDAEPVLMRMHGQEEPQGPEIPMNVYGQENPESPEIPMGLYGVGKMEEEPFPVAGDDRSYEYFDCVTQVRDLTVAEGKVLTYQFNDYGNVVAVHDELGFAAFAKFSMGKPNTPEAVSKLQRLVVNLLDVHDFTEDSGWRTGVIGPDGIARENEVVRMDTKHLCMELPAPKWVSPEETSYAEYLKPCKAGEHTFSVYVRSRGDVLAWAELAWRDNDSQWHTVTSEQVRRVGSPLRLTCTIDLPQAATVRCRVLAGDGRGAAWFYRAQLERGALANRHGLLQSANFTALAVGELPEGWMIGEGSPETEDDRSPRIALAKESAFRPKDLDGNCLRLVGTPGKRNGVYQELEIRGEKGDNYVMGGWARAWAAPAKENRTFRLRARFQKRDGTWVDGGTADWNEEWVDWQYACGAAVAPAAYQKIRVYIDFDENLNEAQIGAVSLNKEYYGQNFAYDEKNNVTAVSTLLGQKDKAEYDKFDNLTSYVQPGREAGDKYTFFYGNTDAEKKRHLPLRSETPLGLIAETKYDAYGNPTESTARDKTSGRFMRTQTTYTANGNYAASTTDALEQTTLVNIDSNKGLTLSATDPAGQRVTYQYDAASRVTQVQTDADGKVYQNAYTYQKDRLKTASHNTTGDPKDNVTYTFEADGLGNQTRVSVGWQTLSTNVYTDTGDKLLEAVKYGNGGKVSYTYDSFKRTTGIRYDDATQPRFAYEYGANGAVGRIKDAELGREVRMAYDLAERPVEAELYENGALKYRLAQEYDRFEQPSVLHERVEEPDDTRSEYTISAEYDKESKPTAIIYEGRRMTETGVPDEKSKRKLAYHYDGLGRIAKRNFHANGEADAQTAAPLFQSEYTYATGGYAANSTTAQVQSIRQAGQKREYWYDKNGNITRECWHGKAVEGGDLSFEGEPITSEEGAPLTLDAAGLEARYNTTYAYDPLGQLIRVDDEREGATWTYRYDQGGNILEKKRYGYTTAADLSAFTPEQVVPYSYGDANWKDKLTAYDGKPIACDPIGNPLFYDGWTYAWKAGRMLHSMVRDGVDAQFTYDHTGLRAKKSVNGVDTLYTLNGKRITHMRKGPVQMHFFYDAQGRPAMVRYNDTDYAYLQNLQGDVTGIVDMTGTIVVEYRYDAWGKPVATTGSMAETLGYDNPFRYRGYVYDEETGLFWVSTRYYNPEWGRFINADTLLGKTGALLSHNAFAYCMNNPVNNVDPDGKAAIGAAAAGPPGWLIGVVLGLIFIAVISKPRSGTRQASNSGGAITAPIPGPLLPPATANPAATPAPTTIAQPIPIPYAISTPAPTPSVTPIYRRGGYTYRNLTPRPGVDLNGLSFQLTIPPGRYVATTMEAINATGVLTAFQDKPNHVAVTPRNITELSEWAATRDNAESAPHPYTILLHSLTMRGR